MDENPYAFISTTSTCEELNSFRKNNELCDIALKVNKKAFNAHRVVLCTVSPYFKALFTSDFAESKQSTIEIHGFEPEIVELIIDFAYANKITITRTNALDLLTAADHFQILQLKNGVSDYLEKNINLLNCFEVLCAADMLNCVNLRKKCKSFILRNFQEVWQQEIFLNLDHKLLIDLTSDNELMVEKEETVFEAVFKWMDFNTNERKPYLDEVLQTVRLDLLRTDFLHDVVANHPILKEYGSVQRQIIDILISRTPGGRPLASQSKHRKMIFDRLGLAVGIRKKRWFIASQNIITSYDFVLDMRGDQLPSMVYIDKVPAVATIGNHLFAIRDFSACKGYVEDNVEHEQHHYYFLEIFDLTLNVWDDGIMIPGVTDYPSLTFMMVAHNGLLYIKASNKERLDIFNIEKKEWGESSDMTFNQYNYYRAMCCHDLCIYIIGGCDVVSQRYNISSNSWYVMPPLTLEDPLEIAVKDGKIFAKNNSEAMIYDCYNNQWSSYHLDESQIYDLPI